VFLGSDDGKLLAIAEYGEHDVADLMSHSAQSYHLGFGLALKSVIVVQDWVMKLTALTFPDADESDSVDSSPGQRRAALWFILALVPVKLPDCLTSGSRPK
jgi:hypothetical protein